MASKNKLKSKIKPIAKKDHFEALLENMNDNIKLVAEGQVAFHEEFTEFQKETRDNFKTVFDYLSRIDNELQDIKNSLKRLEETKVDKGELNALTQRVARLERELEECKGSLGAKK